MRRLLSLVAVGVLGCVAAPRPIPEPVAPAQGEPERSTQALVEQASDAFETGRWEEARAAFTEVARRRRDDPAVLFDLGLIAERQERPTEAIERYEAARALDSRHRPTILNLGRAYCAAGRTEAAVALYQAALADPSKGGDLELENNLSVAYRLAKRLDEAEAVARRVLTRARDNPGAYRNLALVAYERGNLRLAELLATEARRLDDRDPRASNTLGLVALKLGDVAQAQGHFRRALELDARFAPAMANLGAVALSYRDYQGAERAMRKVLELEPANTDALVALGRALHGQRADAKKGDEAGQVFERALELKADEADALCGAGWAYSSQRSTWEKALAYFARCRALPTSSEADRAAIDNAVQGIEVRRRGGAGGSDSSR